MALEARAGRARQSRGVWIAVALFAALPFCSTPVGPASAADLARYKLPKTAVTASWYGRPNHGRPTASGERFDRNAMTAAHRSLPFGTVLRVVNVENGEQVLVRINDRGPHNRRRAIDLSEAAARKLGMVKDGIADVLLAIVKPAQRESGWKPLPAGASDGVNLAADPAAQNETFQ